MARKKARREPRPAPATEQDADSPVVSDDDGIDAGYEPDSAEMGNINGMDDAESPVVSDDDGIEAGYDADALNGDANGVASDDGGENKIAMDVERLSDLGSASDEANEGRGWLLKQNGDAESESGSSSDGEMNPVGNIPMRWYDGYDHIGYDRSGEQILAKNKPTALDLASDPHAWRKVYDEKNDEMIELSHAELKQIARLRSGKYPTSTTPSNIGREIDGDNEYEVDEVVNWSGPVNQQPMPSGTEPRSRFVPSRHEARLVVKMVRAMRAGHLNTPDAKEEFERLYSYDVWADHEPKTREEMSKSERFRDKMKVPAPKPKLPQHDESYNPPMEYLPNYWQKKNFAKLEENRRGTRYLPEKFSALRHVPRYKSFIRERFERCLDLYLAVRVPIDKSRNRLDEIDEIVQNLPKPVDLRPFPTDCVATFRSLPVRARTFDLHPSGRWIVCGCDDGCVRIIDATTGYVRKCWNFIRLLKIAAAQYLGREQEIENMDVPTGKEEPDEDEDNTPLTEKEKEEEEEKVKEMKKSVTKGTPVTSVAWCPRSKAVVFAASVGNALIVTDASRALGVDHNDSDVIFRKVSMFTNPDVEMDEDELKELQEEKERKVRQSMREAGVVWHDFNFDPEEEEEEDDDDDGLGTALEEKRCKMIIVKHGRPLRSMCWHRKGDYLACVGREATKGTIYVHRVSRRATQIPFNRSSTVQCVKFHPNRPFFLVATMHRVRIYNLMTQRLVKTLVPRMTWISSIDIHPASGDHVLVTSYDRGVCWLDLDLSTRPYRTIRNHSKAVRVGKYHPRLPLFVTADDNAQCHVFHATVYDDLTKNALIVPVKVLSRCSGLRNALGVLDVEWHPTLPLLYTCGADGTIRLYADCSQQQTPAAEPTPATEEDLKV